MSPARWPPPPPGTGGWLARRCQELPAQAFVHPALASELFTAGHVAAFSYASFTREHPDPDGFHSLKFAHALQRREDIKAFFWDFLCMPREDPGGELPSGEDKAMLENGMNGDGRRRFDPDLSLL
jgi:hypothetical protein